MWSAFTRKVGLIWRETSLRSRIGFTLAILVVTRVLAVIPLPGIDASRIQALFSGNQFLNLLNIFSGGGLSSLSIALLGVGPYITASIIMQLLTLMIPRVKEMYQEEGDAGRMQFAQYSRILTVPLALIQGFAFITLFQKQGILPPLSLGVVALDTLIITAGSMLLVWLGELISEFGIGNGISMIIFAGIISRLPASLGQLFFTFDPTQIPVYIAVFVLVIVVIYGVVVVTEAERPIPITQARQVRDGRSYGDNYLPLRLNQAGVIPIIFALSILLFPQMIFQFFSSAHSVTIASIATKGLTLLSNQWFYDITYFILVVLFTYFYTAVTFDPDQVSENLQKSGSFIPGVRPGQPTADYISRTLVRLVLVGAVFLGFIAVLPLILRSVTGIQSLAIGGTALLIVVSVVIDLVKKIDAQVTVQEY
jgi:preprotein translocase subunit SecY